MSPAELITRRLKTRIKTAGANLPVESLLLQALDGEKKSTASSGILLTVHISEQLEEPLPHYKFEVKARLVCSIDDDRSGETFRENYEALWAAFDFLTRSDNCEELGDEYDKTTTHIFSVDGFQLGAGDEPDYQEDDNGGTWTTTFLATLTGRAN